MEDREDLNEQRVEEESEKIKKEKAELLIERAREDIREFYKLNEILLGIQAGLLAIFFGLADNSRIVCIVFGLVGFLIAFVWYKVANDLPSFRRTLKYGMKSIRDTSWVRPTPLGPPLPDLKLKSLTFNPDAIPFPSSGESVKKMIEIVERAKRKPKEFLKNSLKTDFSIYFSKMEDINRKSFFQETINQFPKIFVFAWAILTFIYVVDLFSQFFPNQDFFNFFRDLL